VERVKTKVITVRIAPDDAQRAEIAARVDGISVNEVFRRALLEYFERKRADTDFVERAKSHGREGRRDRRR
jgi:hypothetical protein